MPHRPRLRRAGARAVAHRRAAHDRRGPHGALDARLLPAAGRRRTADHLLGRPHPRRSLVLDPAHAGVPERRADPVDDRVVPGRRRRARPPGRDAERPARPGVAAIGCASCSATSTTRSRSSGPTSRAFDMRHVDPPSTSRSSASTSRTRPCGCKTLGPLPDDPNLHRAALAYASDYTILEPILRAHGRPGRRRASRSRASTTPCGGTGSVASTSGCSTCRSRRTRTAGAASASVASSAATAC